MARQTMARKPLEASPTPQLSPAPDLDLVAAGVAVGGDALAEGHAVVRSTEKKRHFFDTIDYTKMGVGTWREPFLRCLAEHGHIMTACKVAGISHTVMNKTRKEDPEFNRQFEEAYDASTDMLLDALTRRIHEGDTTAIIFALKNRLPERWSEKSRIELTTRVDVTKLTPDQLRQLAETGSIV